MKMGQMEVCLLNKLHGYGINIIMLLFVRCWNIFQDPPTVHICGYSGTKFVLKKYYDEKTMGPSISHDEYLAKIKALK